MKRMIRLIAVVSAVSLIGTFTSGSMRPVSYTHLDVYKRQPYGTKALNAIFTFLLSKNKG